MDDFKRRSMHLILRLRKGDRTSLAALDMFMDSFNVDSRDGKTAGLIMISTQCMPMRDTLDRFKRIVRLIDDGMISDVWWWPHGGREDRWYVKTEAEAVALRMAMEIEPE